MIQGRPQTSVSSRVGAEELQRNARVRESERARQRVTRRKTARRIGAGRAVPEEILHVDGVRRACPLRRHLTRPEVQHQADH